MDPITIILVVAGLAVGFGANNVVTKKKLGSAEDAANKELAKAKKEATKLVDEARQKADQESEQSRRDEQSRRREIKDIEQRLLDREVSYDKKLLDMDKRAEKLRGGENEVEELKDEIRVIRKKQQDKLEKIAK
ncbi:MAG: Rnase Y domain-containing protein, partial [Candidatus Saccharibacteria bacterium]